MTRALFNYPKSFTISTLEPKTNGTVIKKVSTGGTPKTNIKEYWDGQIPWITPKEVCAEKDKIFFTSTERCITETGLDNSGAKVLPAGTVMLTKRAPVGEVAINAVPMTTNQGFLNFTCGSELDPLYLYFWFKANKPYLEVVADGSTYLELYSRDLSELIIGFPPLKEQKAITKLLLSLELSLSMGTALESTTSDISLIDGIHNDTIFLRSVKNKIMLKLISGELTIDALVNKLWQKST